LAYSQKKIVKNRPTRISSKKKKKEKKNSLPTYPVLKFHVTVNSTIILFGLTENEAQSVP
jgi:hypothetical protein